MGAVANFTAQIQTLDIPGAEDRLLSYRFRAMRTLCLPYEGSRLQGGQGDRRQEAREPSQPEVQRDGAGRVRASAASGGRLFQELRGSLPYCVPGRQHRGHAWKGHQDRGQDWQVNAYFHIATIKISECAK